MANAKNEPPKNEPPTPPDANSGSKDLTRDQLKVPTGTDDATVDTILQKAVDYGITTAAGAQKFLEDELSKGAAAEHLLSGATGATLPKAPLVRLMKKARRLPVSKTSSGAWFHALVQKGSVVPWHLTDEDGKPAPIPKDCLVLTNDQGERIERLSEPTSRELDAITGSAEEDKRRLKADLPMGPQRSMGVSSI